MPISTLFQRKTAVCTVTLKDDLDSLLLHPCVDPGQPAPDLVIEGAVQLTLTAPRAVLSCRVVLEGLADCYGGVGFPYEGSTTLHKELEIDLKGEVLDVGTHAWSWLFAVPATTACYQKCPFGRVRHYVKATFRFAAKHQTSVSSVPVGLMVHHNPNPPGEPAYSQVHMQCDSQNLGPVSVVFSSPHLTVASLLSMRVDILAPNVNATILSVEGVITQAFTITFDEPGKVAKPMPERHVLPKVKPVAPPESISGSGEGLFAKTLASVLSERRGRSGSGASSPRSRASSKKAKGKGKEKEVVDIFNGDFYKNIPLMEGDLLVLDADPLKKLKKNEEWSYSRILRILDSRYCRPSTLKETEGRIRVRHVLSLEIRYKIEGDPAVKLLELKKPLQITSCCVMREVLPAYTEAGSSQQEMSLEPVRCLCHIPLRQMVDRDGEQLRRAGEVSTDATQDAATLTAARLAKSPAVSATLRGRPRSFADFGGEEREASASSLGGVGGSLAVPLAGGRARANSMTEVGVIV